MKKLLLICLITLLNLLGNIGFAQKQYAGIEIGGKGLKIYIVDVRDLENSVWVIDKFWTEDINILKGIVGSGEILKKDIKTTSDKINLNIGKISKEFRIEKDRIFIVASAAVSDAQNVTTLTTQIKSDTGFETSLIKAEEESEFLFRGSVPTKSLKDALMFDIGSGNTKGGFLNDDSDNTFISFEMSTGTIGLTENLTKKTKVGRIEDFVKKIDDNYPLLVAEIEKEYSEKNSQLNNKKKIYTVGGSVWAFYTLYFQDDTAQNLLEYKMDDVLNYDDMLRNEYDSFAELAKTNPEIDKVLKTFSRENLLASNNILIATLKSIKKINNKKIFFGKQPEISWVVSFISNNLRNEKKNKKK